MKERLLKAWQRLPGAEQKTLVQFAEFLAAQAGPVEELPTEPVAVPRPEGPESTVHALKRLKRIYPMLEADQRLLGEASQFLVERMTGTPDHEIVEKMERYFAERYQAWRATRLG